MNIDWVDSTHPRDVVGIAPDGGFYIHASLHPLGTKGALDRSQSTGIKGKLRSSELYFPMPWIRSELSSVLKRRSNEIPSAFRNKTFTALYETLPMLLKRGRTGRSTRLS